jgi:hypothetical protein
MSKEVSGFLAADGTFFERESNCRRYEFTLELRTLCDSHGINFENFMTTLNAWHTQVKGYYDADANCIDRQAIGQTARFDAGDDVDDDGDDIPAFLPPERDIPHTPVGDKNAPGFLELAIRKHK